MTTMTTTRQTATRTRTRSRYITTYAGELLARPGSGRQARSTRRCTGSVHSSRSPRSTSIGARAVVEHPGRAARSRERPALIKILDDNPIKSSLDSIGKEDFVATTATALGTIADPSAIPALDARRRRARAAQRRGAPRAAEALASCLAAAPEPRDVDDAVLAALLDDDPRPQRRRAQRRDATSPTAGSRGAASRPLAPRRSQTARRDRLRAR